MSPLPTQMRDRWQSRAEPEPGHGTIYWHMLLRDYPEARILARKTQGTLSRFSGFHMTPEEWLHMTTLIAGSTDEISAEQMDIMLFEAQRNLSDVQPIPVTFRHVLYHPEAIMLGVEPERALDPILKATQSATRAATGSNGVINGSLPRWTPHMTVSYSETEQPAEPIIAALGKQVPACQVVISAVSLVVQWGPERLWDWEPVGTIRLGSAR